MKLTQDEVLSILRHAGSFFAGVITVGGLFALFSASQAADLSVAINDIIQGLSKATDGIFKVVVVVGPMITTLMTKWAVTAVSQPAQVKAVETIRDVEIVVGPSAPQDLQDAAADDSRPKIVRSRPENL